MTGTDPIREDLALQLNEAEILARLDGDWQLLADLCDLSLTELPGMMQTLAEAVKAQDANAVHRSAHRLKGSLSIFGEGPHTRDCITLEEMALNLDLSRTQEVLCGLERHLDSFSAAVAALGKESHARADCR
jgi:HPt (histidine-containing phosphotransfer) domain-containing protein